MNLTDQQRETVRRWVAEGAGLSEVQRRLKDEFGLSMTFIDVRFLVLDLGAKVKDKPEPRPPPPPPEEEEPLGDEEDLTGTPQAGSAGSTSSPQAGSPQAGGGPSTGSGQGKVQVTLDRVVQAGAVMSGDVTFSDGTRAKWFLDQHGRLGLDAGGKAGYRPPAQDVQSFQTQLRSLLQSRGY